MHPPGKPPPAPTSRSPPTNAVAQSLEGPKSQDEDEDVARLLATLIALSSVRVSQPRIYVGRSGGWWQVLAAGVGAWAREGLDISAPTAAADATFGSWQPRAVCPFVVILVMAAAKEPANRRANHIPSGNSEYSAHSTGRSARLKTSGLYTFWTLQKKQTEFKIAWEWRLFSTVLKFKQHHNRHMPNEIWTALWNWHDFSWAPKSKLQHSHHPSIPHFLYSPQMPGEKC